MVYGNVCNGSFDQMAHTWWLPLRRCTVPLSHDTKLCNCVPNGHARMSIFALQLWVLLFYNKHIRKQLGYIRRNLSYLEQYLSTGYAPTSKEIKMLLTIMKLFEQQEYMYKNKTHSVENRIVSIERPYLRPIVRGKVKAPVEFGAKFDLSIDTEGYGRIEKISFDAYNESTCLQDAVERFKNRTGFYPERVLADQIYRTRDNRAYCKLHGIRLSGPKLGRPTETAKEDKKQEYQDNTDRIEVERAFSLSKRCYGMGLIRTKIEETTLTSIALSVFVTNLFKIQARILFALILLFRLIGYQPADLELETV